MDLVSKKVTSWTKCPNYLVDLVSNYNFFFSKHHPGSLHGGHLVQTAIKANLHC